MDPQKEYKSKQWNPEHEKLMSSAVKMLVEFNASHPNLSELKLVCFDIVLVLLHVQRAFWSG